MGRNKTQAVGTGTGPALASGCRRLRASTMWIQLTRKLADFLDGVDVSHRQVGDVFELPTSEAHLLIAENWAQAHIPPITRSSIVHASHPAHLDNLTVSARVPATTLRQHHIRLPLNRLIALDHDRRRAEDRIRDEIHDVTGSDSDRQLIPAR